MTYVKLLKSCQNLHICWFAFCFSIATFCRSDFVWTLNTSSLWWWSSPSTRPSPSPLSWNSQYSSSLNDNWWLMSNYWNRARIYTFVDSHFAFQLQLFGLWTLLHDDDDLHHQQDHHHRHYHEIHNIHHHSMITDDLCQIIEIVPESTHLLIRILLFNCNFLQIWLIWFCLKSESRTLIKNQG